ncbi:MAG: NADPH-dependent 7-cyano-7-deazaguanine reductase QueF [Woeseia sp.]
MSAPLGRKSVYPGRYAPELLYPVSREENRRTLGIEKALPFAGEDIWNAFEMTWLDRGGKPRVAMATLRVPADSATMIESKSLKLYLNSLAMQRFDSEEDVARLLVKDLSEVTRCSVAATLTSPAVAAATGIGVLPGECIDQLDVHCDTWQVDPGLLHCAGQEDVEEQLHSHLMRSNCPVTGQPDFGSVLIHYRGPQIDRAALLRYLVSYRNHCDFHESCVERIFVDLKERCSPPQLTVYARFNRRGGIDINPFRSDFQAAADNIRLWRQ